MVTGDKEIGGGLVRLPIVSGETRLLPGRELTAEEVLSIPPRNRQALVSLGMLEILPKKGKL